MSPCEFFQKTLLMRNSWPFPHSLLDRRLEPLRVGGSVGARHRPARLGFSSYPGRRQIIKAEANETISRGRSKRREDGGVGDEGAREAEWSVSTCGHRPPGSPRVGLGLKGARKPKIRCPGHHRLCHPGFHRDAPILPARRAAAGGTKGRGQDEGWSRMMTRPLL